MRVGAENVRFSTNLLVRAVMQMSLGERPFACTTRARKRPPVAERLNEHCKSGEQVR
jgi:hypothetical protein